MKREQVVILNITIEKKRWTTRVTPCENNKQKSPLRSQTTQMASKKSHPPPIMTLRLLSKMIKSPKRSTTNSNTDLMTSNK